MGADCRLKSVLRPAIAASVCALLVAGVRAAPPASRPMVAPESRIGIGIDHVPVAVQDLEHASDTYRKLGFTLKRGRAHTNGIRNAHIKFANGPYIELITADRADDPTAAEYQRLLAAGEGPAYLGLMADDLAAVSAKLAEAGTATAWEAGLLVFTSTDLRCLFFGSPARSPSDRPEHYRHANGAVAMIGVWVAADDESPFSTVLQSLGAVVAPRTANVPATTTTAVMALKNGDITLLPANRQWLAGRPIIGIVLTTPDLSRVQAVLAAARIAPSAVTKSPDGRSLFVSPSVTHGLWLEFRTP